MDACDPVKLFIKNEPHKQSKIKEGRLRLIFSVSLADNIICRLLCTLQNSLEIENWESIPSKPGMGLHDKGLEVLKSNVESIAKYGIPCETDIAGWDFCVNKDDFTMDADRRIALAVGQGTPWAKILKAHFYCMARKVVILSDGRMFAQVLPGIMPSGWYNTSSTNSAIRVYTHYAICWLQKLEPSIIAAGDDGVERIIQDAFESYLAFGKRVKMFNEVSCEDFSFCSTKFTDGTAYPENIAKQLYNLLCYKCLNEEDYYSRRSDFLWEVRNHPNKVYLSQLVERSGWGFEPQNVEFHSIGFDPLIAQNCYFSAKQNAERLQGSPINGLDQMFSPGLSFRHPILMTRNKSQKTKQKSQNNANNKPQPKKKTPWADGGAVLGRAAGQLSGLPGAGNILSGVGRWLGSGIGSIFGSGDYAVAGPKPGYNVLSGQVPKFSSTHATNIVCHREYLGDIVGSTAFKNVSYPLNPGMSTTFPWLSTVAANYQQYKFHGLVFEFKSLVTDFVTNGTPGVVVMTTNYNADQPPFVSRQEAENAEFAASCKPTQDIMHMIECKGDNTANKLYNVRTGSVPASQDLRLYDYGQTQFISQANPSNSLVLGELYVSYCVEFFKPVLDLENNTTTAQGFHAYRTSCTSASPFGSASTFTSGSISGSVSSNGNVTFTGLTVGVVYRFSVYFASATSAQVTGASPLTGDPYYNILQGDTYYGINVTNGPNEFYGAYIRALTPTVTYSISATISGSCTVDIFLDTIDPMVTV
nr:MAG: putative RNA-dependent RNA polymerase [Barnaviridae sp.]